MTTIYCTKKFGDFLGKERLTSSDNLIKSDFGDWNGHLFFYHGKKYLMFVNNKTYYALLFPAFKKADLKDFENAFLQRLLHQFVCDKVISQNDTLVVLQKLLPVALTRTNNDKRTIGILNEYILEFKVSFDHFGWENEDVAVMNSKLNDTIIGIGSGPIKEGDWGRSIAEMKALINAGN